MSLTYAFFVESSIEINQGVYFLLSIFTNLEQVRNSAKPKLSRKPTDIRYQVLYTVMYSFCGDQQSK